MKENISQKSVRTCQGASTSMNVKKDILKLVEDSQQKTNADSKRIVPTATKIAGMIRRRMT